MSNEDKLDIVHSDLELIKNTLDFVIIRANDDDITAIFEMIRRQIEHTQNTIK